MGNHKGGATTREGQPQGIAPTISNGHVGAILYGCPWYKINSFIRAIRCTRCALSNKTPAKNMANEAR